MRTEANRAKSDKRVYSTAVRRNRPIDVVSHAVSEHHHTDMSKPLAYTVGIQNVKIKRPQQPYTPE